MCRVRLKHDLKVAEKQSVNDRNQTAMTARFSPMRIVDDLGRRMRLGTVMLLVIATASTVIPAVASAQSETS